MISWKVSSKLLDSKLHANASSIHQLGIDTMGRIYMRYYMLLEEMLRRPLSLSELGRTWKET
jgi:hypothetical protein